MSSGDDDVELAPADAAVLLYRIATFLVPIPIGLFTYLCWRTSTAWRRPHDTRGPGANPVLTGA